MNWISTISNKKYWIPKIKTLIEKKNTYLAYLYSGERMRCCSMRSWEPLSPAPINQISILPYVQLNHPINYKLYKANIYENIIFDLHLITRCLVNLIRTFTFFEFTLQSGSYGINNIENIAKSKSVQHTYVLHFSLYSLVYKRVFEICQKKNVHVISLQCSPIQIYILHLLHVEPSFMLIHGNESR